jgi:hypothetical protein
VEILRIDSWIELFSDLTQFSPEIIVEPVCDTIIHHRYGAHGYSLGRIVGRVDVVGEDEHRTDPITLKAKVEP